MKLLTPSKRKALIERVALRFHEEGIQRLKLVGHFEKYLPLFHYRIGEPQKGNHLFVTELFGNREFIPNNTDGRFRLQYQGNYAGLDTVLLTSLGEGMIVPRTRGLDEKILVSPPVYTLEKKNSPKKLLEQDMTSHSESSVSYNPSFIILGNSRSMNPKLRENFDQSLLYLDYMLGFILPSSIRTNVGSEQISSTYHVI